LPGALLHNTNQKFICKNIHLKAQTNNSLVTRNASLTDAVKIPIAHGEGNFYINEDGLKALNDNDQVLYRYCDEEGNISNESNPNGSLENIAGVTNIKRNVFGMMPHPERAADINVGNEDGKLLFESILMEVSA
jgi:phosphoribosylformylglycinamidine synthase